ncbi:UNVERIFIED_CONTAM: histidine kinase/DNA gyrase B/HSP90-like ATPase [Williamsia faeni]
MSDASSTQIEAVRIIRVTPDSGVLRAIGLNQTFESAIADLVDNSLDAQASKVLVRFVVEAGRATQLLVIDNGTGMDEARIDRAMQLGRQKADSDASLGFYGMGLKSASFGHASTLTVFSRRAGSAPEGRRMFRESPRGDFEVDVLDPESVGVRFSNLRSLLGTGTLGTAVQWDDCRTFPASRDPAVTVKFIENKVAALRSHLGLIFHRLLAGSELDITIDVYSADDRESGLPFGVEPINPFGYRRTGHVGYPKTLTAELDHDEVNLECHIWPGRSDTPQFRLSGQAVERFQGLFLYRNNRLLMTGGWSGVTNENKALKLARVAIDIENHLDVFKMSIEKSGVLLSDDLVHAIERATAKDGTKFPDYLDDATDAFKESNRRIHRRAPILPPGQGVHPRVKRAVERASPILEGEAPLRIRWKRMRSDDFLELDRPGRILWLNERYRTSILRDRPGSLNDAPLIKGLLFLLTEEVFRGQKVSSKDREDINFWNEVLTTAAQQE